MLATLALVGGVGNMVLGLSMLLRWPKPPRTAYVHLSTAMLGLAAWAGYLLSDRPDWLAWTVFAWLSLVNGLGDRVLVIGSRDALEPGVRGVRVYTGAVRGVLTSRSPVRLGHATLGAATYFLTLLVALGW